MGELMTVDREGVLKGVFDQYDRQHKGELAPHEIQSLHGDIRMGGISYPQVQIPNCQKQLHIRIFVIIYKLM